MIEHDNGIAISRRLWTWDALILMNWYHSMSTSLLQTGSLVKALCLMLMEKASSLGVFSSPSMMTLLLLQTTTTTTIVECGNGHEGYWQPPLPCPSCTFSFGHRFEPVCGPAPKRVDTRLLYMVQYAMAWWRPLFCRIVFPSMVRVFVFVACAKHMY